MHDEHTIRAHSGDSRVLEPENLWDEILPGHLAARHAPQREAHRGRGGAVPARLGSTDNRDLSTLNSSRRHGGEAGRGRPERHDDARPLHGLRVLDLSNSPSGMQASQTLADFGAEVVHVEPPGGSPLRRTPGFPFIATGQAEHRARPAGRRRPRHRPGPRGRRRRGDRDVPPRRGRAARRSATTSCARTNPGLVYGSVTAFGRTGPYAGAKGYEALVMARLGALSVSGNMVTRPGPAHVSVPFCSYGASQTPAHRHPRSAPRARDERARSAGRHQPREGPGRPGHVELVPPHRPRQVPRRLHAERAGQRPGRAALAARVHAPDRPEQGRPLAAVLAGPTAPVHGDAQGHGARLDAGRRRVEERRVGDGPGQGRRRSGTSSSRPRTPRRSPSGRRCSRPTTTCGPRRCGGAASCSTTRRCSTSARSSRSTTPSADGSASPARSSACRRRRRRLDRGAPSARRRRRRPAGEPVAGPAAAEARHGTRRHPRSAT